MDKRASNDLRAVWWQAAIPVIVRKGAGYKLRVRLPDTREDVQWRIAARQWLCHQHPRGHEPKWLPKAKGWELPSTWFNDLVSQLLSRYGYLYISNPIASRRSVRQHA